MAWFKRFPIEAVTDTAVSVVEDLLTDGPCPRLLHSGIVSVVEPRSVVRLDLHFLKPFARVQLETMVVTDDEDDKSDDADTEEDPLEDSFPFL